MSRFVSGGKIDADTGESVAPPSAEEPAPSGKVNAQWEAVQRELDAERRKRDEARRHAVEGGEKSLFDVLEANKAAKQAAFEEQAKLSNQFRALDDDEIDFLDDVEAKKRLEEERVRQETAHGLKAFREAQKVQEKGEGTGEQGGDEWATEWKASGGKKRKRPADGFRGLVKRKTSEGTEHKDDKTKPSDDAQQAGETKGDKAQAEAPAPTPPAAKKPAEKPKSASPPAKTVLGLGAYDSDDSD